MNIQLGNTTSPQRKIYKNFTVGTTKSVTFKNDEDVVNPTLLMTYESGIDRYNYAYIEQLHRYYWIASIKELTGRMCELQLKCDVLMTYKPDIADTTLTIVRKGTGGSSMIPDTKLPLYPYRDLVVVQFEENKFFSGSFSEATPCFVLNVAGK